MAVSRHRVLLSAYVGALTLWGMPTAATMLPSFPVKLSPGERSAVAALACPGSSGKASSIEASAQTRHLASAEYADVTCSPETALGDAPVVSRTYCKRNAARWICAERTRYVVHVERGQKTYMEIGSDADVNGRLSLVKYLVGLGRYQGFDIGRNVRGAWCGVSNAPRGDLRVQCGVIEMLVVDDAHVGPAKYRVYGVNFAPVP